MINHQKTVRRTTSFSYKEHVFYKKKQQHEEEIISTSSFEHFEFRWENFPMAFPFDGKPQCCYSKQAL